MNLRYRQCPKCGHAASPAGAMLEDECPACGVLFRKFLAARGTVPVAKDRNGRTSSGVLAWLAGLLETPSEGRQVRAMAGAAMGDLGLLNRAHEVAALMKVFGLLLMLAALVWGGMLLARIWRERAAGN